MHAIDICTCKLIGYNIGHLKCPWWCASEGLIICCPPAVSSGWNVCWCICLYCSVSLCVNVVVLSLPLSWWLASVSHPFYSSLVVWLFIGRVDLVSGGGRTNTQHNTIHTPHHTHSITHHTPHHTPYPIHHTYPTPKVATTSRRESCSCQIRQYATCNRQHATLLWMCSGQYMSMQWAQTWYDNTE